MPVLFLLGTFYFATWAGKGFFLAVRVYAAGGSDEWILGSGIAGVGAAVTALCMLGYRHAKRGSSPGTSTWRVPAVVAALGFLAGGLPMILSSLGRLVR